MLIAGIQLRGFSKVGSYEGTGGANGAFIYTGFKPRFVIIKKYTGAENWEMKDTKIDTYNVMDARINMNSNAAEGGGTNGDRIDFLSNGFKCRDGAGQHNDSNSYVYYAVGEETLVGTNGVCGLNRRNYEHIKKIKNFIFTTFGLTKVKINVKGLEKNKS